MPRNELREVRWFHSSGEKTDLGSTRATTGISGSAFSSTRFR
jgi:hypothetical protein